MSTHLKLRLAIFFPAIYSSVYFFISSGLGGCVSTILLTFDTKKLLRCSATLPGSSIATPSSFNQIFVDFFEANPDIDMMVLQLFLESSPWMLLSRCSFLALSHLILNLFLNCLKASQISSSFVLIASSLILFLILISSNNSFVSHGALSGLICIFLSGTR